MLKRFCDRCGVEIPMEQAMGDGDLILRKINGKPFDLCQECQDRLKNWFDNQIDMGQFVKMCADCQFLNVYPSLLSKYGKKDSESIGGADDKRNGDTE